LPRMAQSRIVSEHFHTAIAFLIWSGDEDLPGRFHDDGGRTASEQSFMDDSNGRGPSTLPRYQRGGRMGRMATAGGSA
jgi:hypothetical protein